MDAECCKEGEGELTAARRPDAAPAAGKAEIVVETADALYTNAADAERAADSGGHYLVKVKTTRLSSSRRSGFASETTPPSPTKAARATSVTAA